jgi:Ca2+:H+ antiporter
MGCAFFLGGCFYKVQVFQQAGASVQCSLLLLSCLALGLPTAYGSMMTDADDQNAWTVLEVSRYVSIFLLLAYGAYLYFQLKTHTFLFQSEDGGEEEEVADMNPMVATIVLACATVVTSMTTDLVIDAIDGTVEQWQCSQEFIGIILLPIIGNAAEHYTAVTTAVYNKMDLSLGVAVGSSCQMALLVTPFTVIFGWAFDQPMSLDFHPFQLLVLLFSVLVVSSILSNGQTNWLEGVMLLLAYIIITFIYYFERPKVSTYNERPFQAAVPPGGGGSPSPSPPPSAPMPSPK